MNNYSIAITLHDGTRQGYTPYTFEGAVAEAERIDQAERVASNLLQQAKRPEDAAHIFNTQHKRIEVLDPNGKSVSLIRG